MISVLSRWTVLFDLFLIFGGREKLNEEDWERARSREYGSDGGVVCVTSNRRSMIRPHKALAMHEQIILNTIRMEITPCCLLKPIHTHTRAYYFKLLFMLCIVIIIINCGGPVSFICSTSHAAKLRFRKLSVWRASDKWRECDRHCHAFIARIIIIERH